MVRVRIVGGKYHKEAFNKMNDKSKLELVHEVTNPVSSEATMVLSNRDHIGYISEDGGKNCIGNHKLKEMVNDVERCKVILDKKYSNIAYAEVVEVNKYSFCIWNMTDEQIGKLNKQASNSILSNQAKWADLAFGGMRHQFAHQNGIIPKVGEICHLERKWRCKEDGEWVNKETCEPGDEGTVHLVSNENGYSYGVLMQSEKKINQLRRLGYKMTWNTNQEVKNDEFYLNPYTLYKVIYVLPGHFTFVERIGPDEFEMITGRHNYVKLY